MKVKSVFVAVCLLTVAIGGLAQNITNKGKEFWVSYGHHQFMEQSSNSQNMVLYLSAEQPATVTVTLWGSGPNPGTNPGFFWRRTYNIPANTVISTGTATPSFAYPAITGAPGSDGWTMPKQPGGTYDSRLFTNPPPVSTGGAGLFTRGKAFQIQSDVPIVAYSHIYGSASSGATMLLPVDAWGHKYTSVNSEQSYTSNCYSWMYVIANQDNTVFQITTKVPTRAMDKTGLWPNVTKTITLNKGQVYQVIGANLGADANGNGGTNSDGYNLTGTRVRSIANSSGQCYPIAAFSGSSRTDGALQCGTGGGDNDMQQMFPEHAWGKRYVTAPLANSLSASNKQTNGFKIAVADPNTDVKRNGTLIPKATLIDGLYYKYESGTADYIEANGPIMVAQFMAGGSSCLNGGVGDPEMIYLSSMEQAIKRTGFYTNVVENITVNLLTVVIPTGGLPTLKIDGSSIWDHTYPHPNKPGYSIAVKRWSPSEAKQHIVQSDTGFNAITYGLGSVESYGYNAGTNLDNLAAFSSIRNDKDTSTATEHPFTCTSAPFHLSALIGYQPTRMEWMLSGVPGLSPNTNVVVNAPVPTGTVIIGSATYYKYSLPTSYTFSQPGDIFIPIKLTSPTVDNCSSEETVSIKINVRQKPTADFDTTKTDCPSDPIIFTGSTGGSNYTNKQWFWEFPFSALDTGQVVSHLFSPGTYPVKLTVVTDMGCVGDTIKNVMMESIPTASFTMDKHAICEGDTVTFYPGSTPTTAWYWNINRSGSSAQTYNATHNNADSFKLRFDTAGIYYVQHWVKGAGSCNSGTLTDTIRVYGKPRIGFTFAANCLHPDSLVHFTDTSWVPDSTKQVINKWKWYFGDANATPANPDSSMDKNPSHLFGYGEYIIKFIATTDKGCSRDSTDTVFMNIQPRLAFEPLDTICAVAAETDVNKGSVTNSVPGYGWYTGSGITDTAMGKFSSQIAGPGKHTITYHFASDSGCVQTLTRDIVVFATPVADFSVPDSCFNTAGLVQFSNLSTVADTQVLRYSWDFGHGAPPANTSTLENPTHNYTDGSYLIKLTASTAFGCTNTDTVTKTIRLRAALSFAALNAQCFNNDTVLVNKASVTNGVNGTGTYKGPGIIDGNAGKFVPSVAGAGTHTIWYVFDNNGCVDSISRTITIHPKPTITTFAYSPTGCLNETGTVQFSAAATAGASGIKSYRWWFGDSTVAGAESSNLQNPTFNMKDSLYHISLRVYSNNGCVRDSVDTIRFKRTPALTTPSYSPVCEDVSPLTLAAPAVTNGVKGQGVFSGGSFITPAGLFDPMAAGDGVITFQYKFTSNSGCEKTIPLSITVNPRPMASFAADQSVCHGSNVGFTPSTNTANIQTWKWIYGNGDSAIKTTALPFTYNYIDTGKYNVRLVTTSPQGCKSEPFGLTVTVHPVPKASFTLVDTICLPGGPAKFNNTTTFYASNQNLIWKWDFADGSAISSTKHPEHNYTSAGVYPVKLTATSVDGGCSSIFIKNVRTYNKPTVNFNMDPSPVCQGKPVEFTDNSNPNGSPIKSWQWDLGPEGPASGHTVNRLMNSAGDFNIKLTVTNQSSCMASLEKPLKVHIQPKIDAGPSFVVPQGTIVNFQAKANDSTSVSFSWTPKIPQLMNDDQLGAKLMVLNDGIFWLTATTNNFGCSATDSLSVKMLKQIQIPNAFSPNGDGINDLWLIPGLVDYPGHSVEIFNRQGVMVFSSHNYNTPWDGTYNGTPLPVGTYYYIIDPKNGFNIITGSITIIR